MRQRPTGFPTGAGAAAWTGFGTLQMAGYLRQYCLLDHRLCSGRRFRLRALLYSCRQRPLMSKARIALQGRLYGAGLAPSTKCQAMDYVQGQKCSTERSANATVSTLPFGRRQRAMGLITSKHGAKSGSYRETLRLDAATAFFCQTTGLASWPPHPS